MVICQLAGGVIWLVVAIVIDHILNSWYKGKDWNGKSKISQRTQLEEHEDVKELQKTA